jgi:hypothetical protein
MPTAPGAARTDGLELLDGHVRPQLPELGREPVLREPAGKKREESTLLHCLSHNSPYNPPQNKRILDAAEERRNGALSALARGESAIKC